MAPCPLRLILLLYRGPLRQCTREIDAMPFMRRETITPPLAPYNHDGRPADYDHDLHTCGGVVPFPPAGASSKAHVAWAKKGGGVLPLAECLWQAKMATTNGKECPYNMTAAYRLNDILLQEQFGTGRRDDFQVNTGIPMLSRAVNTTP